MQPYQAASQAIRHGEELPYKIGKNIGIGLLSGGSAALATKGINYIIPAIGSVINKFVPENLAKAGLEKIDPRFGKFLNLAQEAGYSFDDVRKFLGEKLENTEKESRNIIEQESPELHQFILDQIKQGRKPLEAGAIATLNRSGQPSFRKAIDKLTKTHKIPWSKIIESVYGLGETAQSEQQQEQPSMQNAGGINEQLAQILQVGNQLMQRYKPNG